MPHIVDMYRTSQYGSWGNAEECNGVYSTIVHNDAAVEDVLEAIANTMVMVGEVGEAVTRTRPEMPEGFAEFLSAYERCFGGTFTLYEANRVLNHNEGPSSIRDAWYLWCEAKGK